MDEPDAIKAVLDEIRPFVSAQDFGAVCDRLEKACAAALHDRHFLDAASLSAMLGSFLSVAGHEEAALDAFVQAESLEPIPRRSLATAAHLVSANRAALAAERVRQVLAQSELDAATRHEGLALLGRIAVAEGYWGEAVLLLHEARKEAVSGDLEAMLWDRALAQALLDHLVARDDVRAYLAFLIKRAESEADDLSKADALELLSRTEGLGSGGAG